MKSKNKFYEEISISKNITVDDNSRLSTQFSQGTDNQKYFSIVDEFETSSASLNDPIDSFKVVSSEKTLVSQISSNFGEKTIALASR